MRSRLPVSLGWGLKRPLAMVNAPGKVRDKKGMTAHAAAAAQPIEGLSAGFDSPRLSVVQAVGNRAAPGIVLFQAIVSSQ